MNDNFCVICGTIIPEGLMACPICEKKIMEQSIDIDKKYNREENNQNGKQKCESVSKVW